MSKTVTTKSILVLAEESAQKFIEIHGRYMNLHINDIIPEYKELAKTCFEMGYKRGLKESGSDL